MLRGKATSDCSTTLFGVLRDDLAAFGSRGNILSLDSFEVLSEESLALSPRLGMRVQLCYRAIVFSPAGI